MDKWKVKKVLISAHDDGWKSVILIPRWDNTTEDEKGEDLKDFVQVQVHLFGILSPNWEPRWRVILILLGDRISLFGFITL